MDWGYFWMGVILIAIGFLVKAFPNLISGYSIMSQGEKDKIDIKGLSVALRNLLVILGVIVGGICNILVYFGLYRIAAMSDYIVPITLIICMFIFQIVYTVKKKKE